MTNSTTLNQIAIGVAQAVTPLRTYFDTIESFSIFMNSLGWNVTTIPSPILALNSSIDNTINDLNTIIGGQTSAGDYLALINSVQNLTQNIYDLKNYTFDPQLTAGGFNNVFPKQLLDYIIITYLNGHQYTVSAILEFLGVIRNEAVLESAFRPSYVHKEIV